MHSLCCIGIFLSLVHSPKIYIELNKGVGNHKTRAVGFNISTKSIGSYRREVLDNDYKWSEGSEEEREAWQTAFNFSSVPDYFSSHLVGFPYVTL